MALTTTEDIFLFIILHTIYGKDYSDLVKDNDPVKEIPVIDECICNILLRPTCHEDGIRLFKYFLKFEKCINMTMEDYFRSNTTDSANRIRYLRSLKPKCFEINVDADILNDYFLWEHTEYLRLYDVINKAEDAWVELHYLDIDNSN